jgi:hypothetical protein
MSGMNRDAQPTDASAGFGLHRFKKDHGGNRTRVSGFAGLCLATRPHGHPIGISDRISAGLLFLLSSQFLRQPNQRVERVRLA